MYKFQMMEFLQFPFLVSKANSSDIINYDPNMFCESLKTRDIVVYCKRFFEL